MATNFTRQPNGEIEISIVLPWAQVSVAIEKQIVIAVENADLPGFRKGKAPRNMVEPKLDKSQIYSQVIQKLLPDAYAAIVKEHNIKPILYPHIHIQKSEPDHDWEFSLHTCEAPIVKLAKYQDLLAKVDKEPKDTHTLRVIDELRKIAQLNLPDMLVEEEANHRLGALVENLTQIGMTTNSYLEAKKLTPETLKSQMAVDARADLEAEFILAHIQTDQKLPDRKKTIDYLLSLV